MREHIDIADQKIGVKTAATITTVLLTGLISAIVTITSITTNFSDGMNEIKVAMAAMKGDYDQKIAILTLRVEKLEGKTEAHDKNDDIHDKTLELMARSLGILEEKTRIKRSR